MSIRKLVLFDIDGTLIKSKGAARAAKAQAIEDVYGVVVDMSTHPFGGKTDWQILREVLEIHGVDPAVIGQRMSDYEAVFARNLSAVIHNYEVYPCLGAIDVVNALNARDDVLVGLVTGNTSLTAPIKLRAAGIDPQWFAVGAYGSEAESRNDLPRIALQRASEQTGCPLQPQDVIIIGDTVADVECSRALGAVAVTVFTGYEARENLVASQPDYLLDDLTSFLATVPL